MGRHAPTHVLVAIRSDLVRVARETGKPAGVAPSVMRYRRLGRVSLYRVQRAVGGTVPRYHTRVPRLTWAQAMPLYGLTPAGALRQPTRTQLVEDLRRVALIAGHPPGELPTTTEYQELGHWALHTVLVHISGSREGSWHDVSLRTGLTNGGRVARGSVTRERVLEDYRRVAAELGREPRGPALTKREFSARVPYTAEGAAYRFGSWTAVSEAAGCVPGVCAVQAT
jgi:hypothetical protein